MASEKFYPWLPLLVDDPKTLESPPCPHKWPGTIELTSMLPSKRGFMYGGPLANT